MFLFDPALHKVLVCSTTWPVDFSLVEHINSISEFNTSSVLANTLSGFQGEFLILGNGSFMLTLSWDISNLCDDLGNSRAGLLLIVFCFSNS